MWLVPLFFYFFILKGIHTYLTPTGISGRLGSCIDCKDFKAVENVHYSFSKPIHILQFRQYHKSDYIMGNKLKCYSYSTDSQFFILAILQSVEISKRDLRIIWSQVQSGFHLASREPLPRFLFFIKSLSSWIINTTHISFWNQLNSQFH